MLRTRSHSDAPLWHAVPLQSSEVFFVEKSVRKVNTLWLHRKWEHGLGTQLKTSVNYAKPCSKNF